MNTFFLRAKTSLHFLKSTATGLIPYIRFPVLRPIMGPGIKNSFNAAFKVWFVESSRLEKVQNKL